MTTENEAAPAPLTVETITSALTAERVQVAQRISKAQGQRAQANEAIRDARERLADIDRLLAATKPRTRKTTIPKGT